MPIPGAPAPAPAPAPPAPTAADRVLAAVLKVWLAGRPHYYLPVQVAARAWLAARGL